MEGLLQQPPLRKAGGVRTADDEVVQRADIEKRKHILERLREAAIGVGWLGSNYAARTADQIDARSRPNKNNQRCQPAA